MSTPRCAYAGHNTTGTQGLIGIDKVGNQIRFYDPLTLEEITRIAAPEPTVHELAISPDHRLAFVPLYGDGIYGANRQPNNKILIIDLTAQSIVDTLDLGAFVAPHGMVCDSSGKLWVVCDIPGKLLRIDPARRLIENAWDCPAKGPHVLTMLPDESRIYVSAKEGAPAVFDVGANRFLRQATAFACQPGRGTDGIAASPDGSQVLMIDNDAGDLHVIETRTGAECDRVPLTLMPLTNPKRSRLSKLMFSPDGRHLIVTAYAGGLAWLIEAADLRRQTVLSLAKGPMGIAYAPDGKTALVTSHDSGLITSIDLVAKRAVSSSDGGSGIEVLAYY